MVFNKADLTPGEEEKTKRFVKMLTKSIEQYRGYIDEKKKIVADLLEKGEFEGLNAKEKDLLITTQEELAGLDKTHKKEVPKHLLTENKLADLSKTKKEAEAFLMSLIEKRKS